MLIIKNFCRLVVGIVFIYSGFVKGIDPLGSAYKFTEYFNAFGMEWMNFSSLFLSFLQSLTEFIIGAALLLNLRVRVASWGALLFMVFFTALTLILALTNPVSDCGCFGDAVILTNWQTFWKNLILLALTLIMFSCRHTFKSALQGGWQNMMLVLLAAGMVSLSLYCYHHLPLLDFRPYAIGKNIPEGTRIPEGEDPDIYEVTLKYKNIQTGEIHAFSEENYPWEDTLNWVYESSEEKLVKRGYIPPIHDLVIEHPQWGDITSKILYDEHITILAIARQLKKASPKEQQQLNKLARFASENGYSFYGLTSSSQSEIFQFTNRNNVPYLFCTADDTQLKTMLRSSSGIIILQNGTVLGKWAGKDIPDIDDLKNRDLGAYCIQHLQLQKEAYLVYTFISLLMLFYAWVRGLQKRKKR